MYMYKFYLNGVHWRAKLFISPGKECSSPTFFESAADCVRLCTGGGFTGLVRCGVHVFFLIDFVSTC